MRKKFTVGFLLLVGTLPHLLSQTVDNIPISNLDAEYIQIVGTFQISKNKLTVSLDFGQKVGVFSSGKEQDVRDENGKKLLFNSMVDALNFMSKRGYTFIQAYTITAANKENVYHYLMKRKDIEVPPDSIKIQITVPR